MSSPSPREQPAIALWFTSPGRVELRNAFAKAPEEGEVRVEALYSAISHGSEMMVYRGEVPPELALDSRLPTLRGTFSYPIRYGYASVGRVLDVGRGVKSLAEGELAFAFNPHETYYTVPAGVVMKLPQDLDPRFGVFVANLETAVNVLLDAAPRIGETIAVIGQGVVGLLITRLARRAGAKTIVASDLHDVRRTLSAESGADEVVDPASQSLAERVHAMTGGRGADVVIEASGRPESLDSAIAAAAPEGRIVVASWYGTRRAELVLGSDFHRKRLTIRSSQVSNLDPSLTPRWSIARRRELAVGYLGELSLGQLISHVMPFNRAAEAYRLIDEQPGEAVQVILDYR